MERHILLLHLTAPDPDTESRRHGKPLRFQRPLRIGIHEFQLMDQDRKKSTYSLGKGRWTCTYVVFLQHRRNELVHLQIRKILSKTYSMARTKLYVSIVSSTHPFYVERRGQRFLKAGGGGGGG